MDNIENRKMLQRALVANYIIPENALDGWIKEDTSIDKNPFLIIDVLRAKEQYRAKVQARERLTELEMIRVLAYAGSKLIHVDLPKKIKEQIWTD